MIEAHNFWAISNANLKYLKSGHKQVVQYPYLPVFQDNYGRFRHDQLDQQECLDIRDDF